LVVDNAKRDAWLVFKEETRQQCCEEVCVRGEKELKAKGVRARLWRLDLSDKRAKRFLDVTFRGEKAGGVKHVQTIVMLCKMYWQNGWIVRVDDGETDESLADLYVTPTLPASRGEGVKGYIDHTQWDYVHSFAVEVECYPNRHWDRLQSNYNRNKNMGFPTVFVVFNQSDVTQLKEKLLAWKAIYVANTAMFEIDHPEMVTIKVVKPHDNQTNDHKLDQTCA